MKKLTAAKAAEYSQGKFLCGPASNTASCVERDSRQAGPESLFAGLVGETNDGNNYAEAAYEKGCRMFLLSSPEASESLGKRHSDAAVILVDDTLAALQIMAKNYLADSDIIKIAVTGSTGKTSTKEMLRCIFESKYRTISNYENYNNHIGVPITAFLVEDDTEVGIFEMGMNHTGEIRVLADIVRPETALITNVGISHIGNLGSRENILSAKLEITEFMGENSNLVYYADNDLLSTINSKKTVYNKIPTGMSDGESSAYLHEASGLVISDVYDNGEAGVDFVLSSDMDGICSFSVPLPGAHNAQNASLAVACALHYGFTLKECADALKNLKVTGNRLNIKSADGIKIINDTYNASPDSVRAAIDVLAALDCKRKVALLADMFELGEGAAAFHREVGAYAGEKGVDLVIAVGEMAENIAAGAAEKTDSSRVLSFKSKDDFLAAAHDIIRIGDGILVKGSHGMHMDQAAEYLAETGAWHE